MAELTGPVVMDAKTFLAGGVAEMTRPTVTYFFKGGQVAGTLISFVVPENADLVFVGGKASGAVLSKIARAITGIPAGWSSPETICSLDNVGNQVILNQKFNSGDRIYLDSTGGLGVSEYIFCIFALNG